ncbi:response regulator [Desertivirga arenae]|uniref:response regulator n=1 Tax=Desertivirga arenae TaxID=2810309 RepID=UPI001A968A10
MILIVDDVPENVYSLQKVLEFHGFQVDTAFSGEEALRKILSKQYVLILLDVQMPGIDGFEVAENIRGFKKAKDTAVVFLSANYTDINMIIKGYNQGAVDYITKPVDTDLLLLKVKTIYKLYEAKQDNSRQNQEILVLYEHAKEYNQTLLGKIERFKQVFDLAGVAQWEYYTENERFIPSAQLNKLFNGDEDISVSKNDFLAKLGLAEDFLTAEPYTATEIRRMSCQIERNSESKEYKILIQPEFEEEKLKRILGVVQQVDDALV